MSSSPSRPYSDPYLSGIALGLVLLTAFITAGRGLGASGAFVSTAAGVVARLSPERAATSPLFAPRLSGGGPWNEWLLLEVGGVLLGGLLSSLVNRRFHLSLERGPRASSRLRVITALLGGGLMGFGAVLARGCTSGLALTGGALLSAGAWLFILAAFAAAYAVTPLLRRAWR